MRTPEISGYRTAGLCDQSEPTLAPPERAPGKSASRSFTKLCGETSFTERLSWVASFIQFGSLRRRRNQSIPVSLTRERKKEPTATASAFFESFEMRVCPVEGAPRCLELATRPFTHFEKPDTKHPKANGSTQRPSVYKNGGVGRTSSFFDAIPKRNRRVCGRYVSIIEPPTLKSG